MTPEDLIIEILKQGKNPIHTNPEIFVEEDTTSDKQ
jgi:hypothetical protein